MKQGNKKSTKEEVGQMRELYRQGMSLNAIGKKFGKDHSTIFYWVRKRGQLLPKKDNPNNVSWQKAKSIRKIVAEKETEKAKISRMISEGLCLNCGKKKEDTRWLKTHYCSMRCWEEKNYPVKNKKCNYF